MFRLLMDYIIHFRFSNYTKYTVLARRVQYRDIEMIQSFRTQPYEERLKRLYLCLLEKRDK